MGDASTELFKSLGLIWSEENEQWLFSAYGMGFTTGIDKVMADKIATLIAEREAQAGLRGRIAEHTEWVLPTVETTFKQEGNHSNYSLQIFDNERLGRLRQLKETTGGGDE